MSELLTHLAWIVPSLITLVMGTIGVIVGRLVTLSVLSAVVDDLKEDMQDAKTDRRRIWERLDSHTGLINRIMGRLNMNGSGRLPQSGD